MSKERIAIYPGSFDPVTLGHLDIIHRGLEVFDGLVIAVATNVAKKAMFTADERVELIQEAVGGDPRVVVDHFDGLLVEYARDRGAVAVLRGLRAVSDFDFEFQMASMNRSLLPEVQTVFLMAGEEHFYVSSSLVKEVAQLGGDVAHHVPPGVAEALRIRIAERGGAR